MTTSTEPKVEAVSPADIKITTMSMSGKLANAFAIVVAAVIALCVSAVLADGKSVIVLKPVEHLPIATAAAMKSKGFDHRLDELLGPTYGIGLHHDQSGYSWTAIKAGSTLKDLIANLGIPAIAAALPSVISTDALKHPVPLLGFKDLQMAGLCAMSFGFIAELVAVVMVIFHALALAGMIPAETAKPLASLIWLILSAGFGIVVCLAIGIYTAEWHGDQPIIPKITLYEHFDFNYGFYLACVGYTSAVLTFFVTVCFSGKPVAGGIGKTILGTTVGLIICATCAVAIAASNEAFKAKPPTDPSVNICAGQKPHHAGPGDSYFGNVQCMYDSVVQTLEQAGGNVTEGYVGGFNAGDRIPITQQYSEVGLCPVNVHWHAGGEHYSAGQFDEFGKGPVKNTSSSGSSSESYSRRQLAGAVRTGFQCHHYNDADTKFTTPYNWQHCTDMIIGETYEIHWPHSAAGACGSKWQYQTPFYDGVFCRDGVISIAPLNTFEKIGVQAQVFTVVNSDEPQYQYDHLFDGMIVNAAEEKGTDMAYYTGSTTGTTRDNMVCSRYTPITWQVDRKCHMISAKSWDKMCQDMKAQAADMSGDLHPHGARELVAHHLTANNQQRE